ncbi:hypothetical protein E2C01_066862 [Portunus trituberculatus]|uniref:Uncharacterized protein n=1 Tax=Portunus trituberculatus TaxID=210409 RepID=A0A5B7HJB6_PORTR|nr:hypothetical protein [Portunus trituberculatus]
MLLDPATHPRPQNPQEHYPHYLPSSQLPFTRSSASSNSLSLSSLQPPPRLADDSSVATN